MPGDDPPRRPRSKASSSRSADAPGMPASECGGSTTAAAASRLATAPRKSIKAGGKSQRKSKSRSKAQKGGEDKKGVDAPITPVPSRPPDSWFRSLLRCGCSGVACCPARDREQILAPTGQAVRDKEKQRKKEARASSRKALARPTNGDSAALETTADDGGPNSEYDDYTTETDYSRQSTVRSDAESSCGMESGRASRDSRQCGAGAVGNQVRVLNLADLQGNEMLPAMLRDGGGRGDLSARSGRSQRSEARSCRSEAQSVRSAASVSVKRYMGHLSEKMSKDEVKKMVKEFTRQMVKGREMGVLRADGAPKLVNCSLSRSLDVFRIKSGEQVQKVQLVDVCRVIYGDPEELSDLETPLDHTCSTLELQSNECISFKFPDQKAAELFTMCMSIFIDGQKPA